MHNDVLVLKSVGTLECSVRVVNPILVSGLDESVNVVSRRIGTQSAAWPKDELTARSDDLNRFLGGCFHLAGVVSAPDQRGIHRPQEGARPQCGLSLAQIGLVVKLQDERPV